MMECCNIENVCDLMVSVQDIECSFGDWLCVWFLNGVLNLLCLVLSWVGLVCLVGYC